MPATTNERMSPGPALSWAASPVSTKMPAPMMAPTPRAVRLTGPSTRRSRCSPSISESRTATGLTAKSWLRSFIPAPPPGRSLAATPICVGVYRFRPGRVESARAPERRGDVPRVGRLEPQGHRPRAPAAHGAPVETHHGQEFDRRRGEEDLPRAAEPRGRDALLAHPEPGPAREGDHQRARHAGEDAGRGRRGDERALLDQEEVRAGRLRDLAVRGHVEALGGPAARGRDTTDDRARVADQLQASPRRDGVAWEGEEGDRYALALAPRQIRRQAAHGEQQGGARPALRREPLARRAARDGEAHGGLGEPRAPDEPTDPSLPQACRPRGGKPQRARRRGEPPRVRGGSERHAAVRPPRVVRAVAGEEPAVEGRAAGVP